MPVAVTLKVADFPALTVAFAGCAVMDGATSDAVTVRTALLLVMLPSASDTVTEKNAPSFELVTAAVV